MQDADFDDLRLFLALARAGSFAGAAERLRLDPTTVSRRLRRAERRIGAALFHRGRGALSPTEPGAALLPAAEAAERAAERAFATVTTRQTRVEGRVRVTSVPIVVNRLLAPAAPAILARHPGLILELIPDRRDYSLTRREADIALRLARPAREATARCRRVGTLHYGVFGGLDAPWAGYIGEMDDLPQARWTGAQPGGDARVRVADAETLIALARRGAVRAAVPIGLAPPDLDRCPGTPPARELWLIAHPDTADLPRNRVVADWIAELCGGLGGRPGGPVEAG